MEVQTYGIAQLVHLGIYIAGGRQIQDCAWDGRGWKELKSGHWDSTLGLSSYIAGIGPWMEVRAIGTAQLVHGLIVECDGRG